MIGAKAIAVGLVALACLVASVSGCDRHDHTAPPMEPSARTLPAAGASSASAGPADTPAHGATGSPSTTSGLCVTSGTLVPLGGARFSVDTPTFRAVTATACEPRAELRFTYHGPTATTRALGSGAVRQQLGLKLRAQDPCNLVYVMWRIEPEQKIVVSIKQNLGQRTSHECGNRGYKNIKPRTSAPAPQIAPSSSHVLRAAMTGDALQVFVDDVSVWEGALGPEAAALEGPVGVRTDNVHIEAELVGPASGSARPCGTGDEGE